MSENIILQKAEDFVLSCIRFYQMLQKEWEYEIIRMLAKIKITTEGNLRDWK